MNKITFKDVANMYLGCMVQFEAFEKDEETGEVIRRWTETGRFEHYNFGAMLARGAKPVLRRGEKLNDAEIAGIWSRHNNFSVNTDEPHAVSAFMAWAFTREGVDLFGLIDNGEAIDAATLGEGAGA